MLYVEERNALLQSKVRGAVVIGKLMDRKVPTLQAFLEDTVELEEINVKENKQKVNDKEYGTELTCNHMSNLQNLKNNSKYENFSSQVGIDKSVPYSDYQNIEMATYF